MDSAVPGFAVFDAPEGINRPPAPEIQESQELIAFFAFIQYDYNTDRAFVASFFYFLSGAYLRRFL